MLLLTDSGSWELSDTFYVLFVLGFIIFVIWITPKLVEKIRK